MDDDWFDDTGYILPGNGASINPRVIHPGCRCHADPPQPHGPYWQWTRYDSGRTITRRLTEPQAALYQKWIANRRRLADIIAEMEKVSEQAAELMLQRPEPRQAARQST